MSTAFQPNRDTIKGSEPDHLLMLSGIGPNDQLQQFGIPLVHELPGMGQNLFNHLSAQITFKVKDGMTLAADADAARFALHYTSHGSSEVNDMLLRTTPMVDERPERVPGFRTKYLHGEVPPDRVKDHLDDAILHQFVNSKTQRPVQFSHQQFSQKGWKSI